MFTIFASFQFADKQLVKKVFKTSGTNFYVRALSHGTGNSKQPKEKKKTKKTEEKEDPCFKKLRSDGEKLEEIHRLLGIARV